MVILVCDAPSENNKNNLHNRFIFVLGEDEIRKLLDDELEYVNFNVCAHRSKEYKSLEGDNLFMGFYIGRKCEVTE